MSDPNPPVIEPLVQHDPAETNLHLSTAPPPVIASDQTKINQLVEHCWSGEIEQVQTMLRQHPEYLDGTYKKKACKGRSKLTGRTLREWTPLHAACYKGCLSTSL